MSCIAIFFLIVLALGLAFVIGLLGWVTVKTNLLGWFMLLIGAAYLIGTVIVHWFRNERFWRARAAERLPFTNDAFDSVFHIFETLIQWVSGLFAYSPTSLKSLPAFTH